MAISIKTSDADKKPVAGVKNWQDIIEDLQTIETAVNTNISDVETLEENTNSVDTTDVLEEGSNPISSQESYDPAVASAISAGLGALNFRNHVRINK